jgi:hypothetical protein
MKKILAVLSLIVIFGFSGCLKKQENPKTEDTGKKEEQKQEAQDKTPPKPDPSKPQNLKAELDIFIDKSSLGKNVRITSELGTGKKLDAVDCLKLSVASRESSFEYDEAEKKYISLVDVESDPAVRSLSSLSLDSLQIGVGEGCNPLEVKIEKDITVSDSDGKPVSSVDINLKDPAKIEIAGLDDWNDLTITWTLSETDENGDIPDGSELIEVKGDVKVASGKVEIDLSQSKEELGKIKSNSGLFLLSAKTNWTESPVDGMNFTVTPVLHITDAVKVNFAK